MALTRSQFYVDTPPPRDPTQRYSMFADHSELARASAAQDLSSTSSSATLPSAAGSVDRLTGLGEKKSSRFFTLKPKTSFSLRPFFSSTSISNLSPSKQRRRKAGEVSTPRRDSYVQTEDDRRAYDEVGVQTLNASTVDVPVQTCSIEWEAGDSYGYRRLPGPAAYRPGYSRYPSGAYSSNLFTPAVSKPPGTALEKTSAAENSFVSPLVTSRLLKYAAPDDSPSSSEKTSLSSQSTATSASALGGVIKNEESADPQKASASLSERSTAPSVPVKYFSAKQLVNDPASTTVLTSEDTKECTNKKSSTDILDVSCVIADETNSNLTGANAIVSEVTLNPDNRAKSEKQVKISNIDKIKDLSNESKISAPRPAGSPASVLKVDRTSSPSKQHSKVKSVHFDLLDSDECLSPPEKRKDSSKPRNVDKDFEALLRDLDILTDEPEESKLQISQNCFPNIGAKHDLIPPHIKSEFEILRQDFLEPIPENAGECPEIEQQDPENTSKYISTEEGNINYFSQNLSLSSVPEIPKEGNELQTPTLTVSESGKENKSNPIESNSLNTTSLTEVPPTKSVSEIDSNSQHANVYENVADTPCEEPVKIVTLPTLPAFFESPTKSDSPTVNELTISAEKHNLPSENIESSTVVSESDMDRLVLSRSSSRSSTMSNNAALDAFYGPGNKFDSCENLDQLEEEIIRSLYSPAFDQVSESKTEDLLCHSQDVGLCKTPEAFASQMRSSILDRLLTGESVEEIVPNQIKNSRLEQTNTAPKTNKICRKQPQKYTATLTRMEQDTVGSLNEINSFNSEDKKGNFDSSVCDNSSLNNPVVTNVKNIEETGGFSFLQYPVLSKVESPKKASVFLFPEVKPLSADVPEQSTIDVSRTEQAEKVPSVLEVRRSSWSTTQPKILNDALKHSPSNSVTSSQTKTSDDLVSRQCDFTNCLRPSQIQNSPFLAKIRSRSASPGLCPDLLSPQFKNNISAAASDIKNDSSKAVGQCDYASCLKPSQAQNSVFSAELSEITANKSSNILNASLRTNTSLTARPDSPIVKRANAFVSGNQQISACNVGENSIAPEEMVPQVKHKSEVFIMLQPPHANDSTVPGGDSHLQNTSSTQLSSASLESQSDPHSESLDTLEKSEHPMTQSADFQQPEILSQSSIPQTTLERLVSPPPPPPPPPLSGIKSCRAFDKNVNNTSSMESMIREQHSNLVKPQIANDIKPSTPKTAMMLELEKRFESKSKLNSGNQVPLGMEGDITNYGDTSISSFPDSATGQENKLNGINSSYSPSVKGIQNGSNGTSSEHREHSSSLPSHKPEDYFRSGTKLTFTPNTVITDEPPPPGAVLLDKKVTVDGDKVHTDKFYAIPVKEVLKEKTSTTKFIPAPPKYEGIGPTEDGVPIGLRNSVKKENMHNWYKTMFKSLHKADSSNDTQEYIIGYSSEPETSGKDKMLKKKSATLDSRLRYDSSSKPSNNLYKQAYPPSAKSSIEIYNVRPRLIEDYEPGQSSVTDNDIRASSKRFLPEMKVPKPTYEYKNGYESDNSYMRKVEQPEGLTSEQQKVWYREIQRGGDIPQFGLGKPAPEKPKEPTIGPLPPPPLNYNVQPSCQQATRPQTLPADYMNQNDSGFCQQMNGVYEVQMRQALHSELQQRMSPCSSQLSPNRSTIKSPSRSPDLRIPARALFDFKAESPKEISLKKGDMVMILRQLDKNWYEGERQGTIGIFPISYVEIVPPEHVSSPVKSSTDGIAKALYDFVAQTSVELSVRKGDTVSLIRRVDANWYEARFNNKKGIIPVSYLQVLQEPVDRSVNSLSPKSHSNSSRCNSGVNDKFLKSSSNPPSPYSASTPSPISVTEGREKFQRGRKGSCLVEPVMYRAIYSYSPQNSDELELQEGDTICVMEMCDDGWYLGTSVRTGVFGIFPGNYVEKVCVIGSTSSKQSGG